MTLLTNAQVEMIRRASSLLPAHQQRSFAGALASRLRDMTKLTDGAVAYAIGAVLAGHGVSADQAAFQPKRESRHIRRRPFVIAGGAT
jgi:hypothetical protein